MRMIAGTIIIVILIAAFIALRPRTARAELLKEGQVAPPFSTQMVQGDQVTPVVELDDRKIGAGTPGPITRKVQEVFQGALHGREPKYRDWLYYV